MEKTVKEFQESTDGNLVNFVQDVRDGVFKDVAQRNYSIGKVTDRAVADIDKLTGIDVTGFEHNVNGDAVKHIEKRHGVNGIHDHSMTDINGYGRIKYVMDNYDNVRLLYDNDGNVEVSLQHKDSKNKPSPKIQYQKRVNGTFYIVEAVPDATAKKLQLVSAYKEKAGDGQEPDVVQSPQAHVRNALAASPDNKITYLPQKVNSKR